MNFKLFIIIALTLLTNKLKAQDTLLGTWQVDWNQTLVSMTSEERQLFDSLLIEQRLKLESRFASRKIKLSSPAEATITYIIDGLEKKSVGTWSLNNNNQLQLNIGDITSIYQINLNTNFILDLENIQTTSRFLPRRLILNKIN